MCASAKVIKLLPMLHQIIESMVIITAAKQSQSGKYNTDLEIISYVLH